MHTVKKFIMSVDMARFSKIQHYYEECFGPEGVNKLKNEIVMILAKGFEKAGRDYKQALMNFEGDGGKFVFNSAADAHHVAVGILEVAELQNAKARKEDIADACRCFRIGIAFGELTYGGDDSNGPSGRVITMATRLESSAKPDCGGCSGEIRICPETYKSLPPDIQQRYGNEELVQGKEHDGKVPARRTRVVPQAPWEPIPKRIVLPEHRKKPAPVEDCFVISPIELRNKRLTDVFDRLVEPACKALNFRAQRADHIPGQDRLPVITNQLTSAPMAVAYLGKASRNWNQDVLLEIGYRLSTGLPLVMLTDEIPAAQRGERPESLKDLLPFYLAQKNVLQVPKNPRQMLDALVAEMKTARTTTPAKEWNTTHPVVELKFSNVKEDLTLTYVSSDAKKLLGLEDERSPDVKALQAKFKERMEPVHYEAYIKERLEILACLRDSSMGLRDGKVAIPVARIPVVFKDTPRDRDNKPTGYLPVVIRYLFQQGTMYLRILYLDVHSCLEQHPDGHWVCNL